MLSALKRRRISIAPGNRRPLEDGSGGKSIAYEVEVLGSIPSFLGLGRGFLHHWLPRTSYDLLPMVHRKTKLDALFELQFIRPAWNCTKCFSFSVNSKLSHWELTKHLVERLHFLLLRRLLKYNCRHQKKIVVFGAHNSLLKLVTVVNHIKNIYWIKRAICMTRKCG